MPSWGRSRHLRRHRWARPEPAAASAAGASRSAPGPAAAAFTKRA